MPRIRGHNSPAMKAGNRSAVLKLLLQHGPMTRQRIAKILRLTPATITNATRELMALGLIGEYGNGADGRQTARRSVPLSIAPNGSYAIGINMGFTGLRIGVVDLAGEVRTSKAGFFYEERTATYVVSQMSRAVQEIIAASDVDALRISGIGVAVAGYVDAQAGIVRSHLGLRWHNVPLGAMLAEALGRPVKLVNNVHAITLAEHLYGATATVDDFALLYVSTVIGAGLVIDGQLYQGHSSGAGMLGHLCIVPNGPLCNCGNRGCLEAVASNLAVLEEARRAIGGGRSSTIREIARVHHVGKGMSLLWAGAQQGDQLACELLRAQATFVGLGAAALFHLYDPARLVLLTPDFDQHLDLGGHTFLEIVAETTGTQVRQQAVQERIISSHLDEKAALQGSAALIFTDFIQAASFGT